MDSVKYMLQSHVKRFDTLDVTQSKRPIKYIYIESNNDALASDHVAGSIVQLDVQNTRIESRDPKNIGRVGVWTHPSSKKIYNDLLVWIMSEGRLRISETLISANPEGRIKELLQQMRCFRREQESEADNALFQDNIKVRYGAKGGGMKDDLLLALMICIRWMIEKRSDLSYIQEANLKGIIDY
jgi:hypothetical protein